MHHAVHLNAEKSLALAAALFPHEKWILKEGNIWVAKTRLRNTPKERAKLAWEIEQVRFFKGPIYAELYLK